MFDILCFMHDELTHYNDVTKVDMETLGMQNAHYDAVIYVAM